MCEPGVVGGGVPAPGELGGASEHVHFQVPTGDRFELVMTCDPSAASGPPDRRDPADPPR
jgi:hypothetical protein